MMPRVASLPNRIVRQIVEELLPAWPGCKERGRGFPPPFTRCIALPQKCIPVTEFKYKPQSTIDSEGFKGGTSHAASDNFAPFFSFVIEITKQIFRVGPKQKEYLIWLEIEIRFSWCTQGRWQRYRFPSLLNSTNLDCVYNLHYNLAPNGVPFCTKSIGKVQLNSNFCLD